MPDFIERLPVDPDTLLVYALAKAAHDVDQWGRHIPSSNVWAYFVSDLGCGRLKYEELSELIARLEGGQGYVTETVSYTLENEYVYVLYPSGVPPFYTPITSFLKELDLLIDRYKKVAARGININHGLLPIISNHVRSRQLVMEVLARAQQISDVSTASCWLMLADYGLGDGGRIRGTEELEALTYSLLEALEHYDLDEDWCYHAGMIHDICRWEVVKTQLTFSSFGCRVSCDASHFIDQLLVLLANYEASLL